VSLVNKARPKWGRNWRVQLFIVVAVMAGAAAYCLPRQGSPQPVHEPARVQAWEKVTPRLNAAELAGQDAAERHCRLVTAFFAERRERCRAFAEEVLSLEGKWNFLKSKLPWAQGDEHRRYLHQRFEEMVVSGPELEELIRSVVNGYACELEGIENELLVAIRADLCDGEPSQLGTGAALGSDDAFRREYSRSLEQVAPIIGHDLGVVIGREAVTWVAADIATNITISLSTALVERLGLSGGILGTGAAIGVETLGVGLAAGFILDALLDRVLKVFGHDPTSDIAGKLSESLSAFESQLLDGDEAEAGGQPGLRDKLKRLRETRSQLREGALKKLILEGGFADASPKEKEVASEN
jgi:hypothetical protein